jgi:hypothetical protein
VITNTPAEATAVVATIEGTDPVGDAYRRLLEDLKGKRLITVITTLRTYNDIVLEECNVDRNAQRGNALFFTASGRQVRKVTAQTVDVPAPVQTTKAAGKKPTKPPAPKVEAQAQSLTSKLVGLVLP